MKKEKKLNPAVSDDIAVKIKVYRISTIVIMLVAAAVRIAALILNYDPDPGYFVSGKLLPVVSAALIAIGALVGASSLVFIPKDSLPDKAGPNTNSVYFISVYAAFIMLFDAGYRFYTSFIAKSEGSGRIFESNKSTILIFILTVICIFSSLGSAACFFLRSSSRRSWKGMGIIGLFPVLRAICGLALPYFDMTVPMNSPVKLLSEFSMMAIMLYFLAEDRFDLPGNHAMPRIWLAISLVGTVVCGSSGISGIFAYFSGAEDNGELLIEAFFSLTTLLYILSRIGGYFTAETEPDEVTDDAAEESAPDGDFKADAEISTDDIANNETTGTDVKEAAKDELGSKRDSDTKFPDTL